MNKKREERWPTTDNIQFPYAIRAALQRAIEARGNWYGEKTRIVCEALLMHPEVRRFYEGQKEAKEKWTHEQTTQK